MYVKHWVIFSEQLIFNDPTHFQGQRLFMNLPKLCFPWNCKWVWPSWKTGCCSRHMNKTIESLYLSVLYYNPSSSCLFEEGLSCSDSSVRPGIFEMENIKDRPCRGKKNSYKKFAEREQVKGVCLHSHIVFISSAQPALVDCGCAFVCVRARVWIMNHSPEEEIWKESLTAKWNH